MYTVIFENGTNYEGGDLENSRWNDMPDLPIIRLEYSFPSLSKENKEGQTALMEGYDSYNHLVERINIQAKEIINKVILLGKIDQQVSIITYDCKTKKISQSTAEFGKEYEGKPSTGWKIGIKSSRYSTTFIT